MIYKKENIIKEYKLLLLAELAQRDGGKLLKPYTYFLLQGHTQMQGRILQHYQTTFEGLCLKVTYLEKKHLIFWRMVVEEWKSYPVAPYLVDGYTLSMEKSKPSFLQWLPEESSHTYFFEEIEEAQREAYTELLGVMQVVLSNYLTLLINNYQE